MPEVLSGLLAFLQQLAVGLLFAAVVCDWRGEVTRGFLFLAVVTALVSALVAVPLSGLARMGGLESALQSGFVVVLLVYSLLLAGHRRLARLSVGAAGLAIGLVLLALSAAGRPAPAVGSSVTFLAFAISALALGAAVAGLLLGHWYLVTPRLPSRPLRLLCDVLLVSFVPLTALAGWYITYGYDAPGAVGGPPGLSGSLLWIGAAMITLFPAAVTLAARACCVDGPGRGRSLQAATGLLYVVAACVLAGGLAGNAVLLGG